MSEKGYEKFTVGANIGGLPDDREGMDRLWDQIKPLHEQLQEPGGEQKANDAVTEAKEKGYIPGAKVKLTHDPEVGEVVGYNEEGGGFYPGGRFPVLVKFERGTFEFALEQLELVNVRSPEYLDSLREKIVNRVLDEYPEADNQEFLNDFRSGKIKPGIDNWAGDAFAWIAHEKEKVSAEDYEYLREQLFSN